VLKGELAVSATERNSAVEGIAVISLTGRVPGANTVEEFWNNLQDGVETITRFSEAELRAAGVDATYSKHPCIENACTIIK
jgi:acyl transferase domain-containing protein